jgi:lysophospholipase L1-like esterase
MDALKVLIKMKFIFLLLFILVISSTQSQTTEISKPEFKRHFYFKVDQYRTLPNTDSEIIFLGNSITAGGNWSELFQDLRVKNRGISGDITEGILYRLDEITESKPAKIFLLIGINDLSRGIEVDSIMNNYRKIVSRIMQDTPETQIYIQSVLPVNDNFEYFKNHTDKGESVLLLNNVLKELANQLKHTYIDLFSSFANDEGKLKAEYTLDGLHLTGEGYVLWKLILEDYLK